MILCKRSFEIVEFGLIIRLKNDAMELKLMDVKLELIIL